MKTTNVQRKILGLATALGLLTAFGTAEANDARKAPVDRPKAQKQSAAEPRPQGRKDSGDAHLDYGKGTQGISLSGPTKRTGSQ